MIKIYVGVVLSDYAVPFCIGLDKQKVEEKMNSDELQGSWWMEEYTLNKDNVIELDS